MQQPPSPSSQPAEVPSNTERFPKDVKRNYLSLLPQEQIIEICLALDPHVPSHVRDSIWPAEIEAAILALKKTAPALTHTSETSASPSSQTVGARDVPYQDVHTPGHNAKGHSVPPMGSLMDDIGTRHSPQLPPAEKSAEKASQDPASMTSGSSAPSSTINVPATPNPTTTATTSQVSTPQPHTSLLQPLAPYPYAPYGYTPQNQPQQPAYPHAPYYPPPLPHHPHSYPPPYPYPGYTAPGYPAGSSSQGHGQPPHSVYSSGSFARGSSAHAPSPGPPPHPSGDDLPSYEEMIVEALLEMGDPEGAAPKDLFTWMASKYPLQTNFRPSASQALQKAYKRGRLEKRMGGRYRLNPTWEGGATSKRTTRKPQTFAQTYATHHPPQPPSSPFTTAPLTHHQHHPPHPPFPHGSNASPAGSYPAYPYGFPPAGYPSYAPGYPGYHPPPGTSVSGQGEAALQPAISASTSSAPPDANSNSGTVSNGQSAKQPEKDSVPEGNDASAWEAAQHILEAINFGSLSLPSGEPGAAPAATVGASTGGSHPPPIIASAGFDASAPASGSTPALRTMLTDDERASLQAQLALLAAQLVEIADAEEEEEEEDEGAVQSTVPVRQPPPTITSHAISPPIQPLSVGLDIHHSPEERETEIELDQTTSNAGVRVDGTTLVMEEEESDEDDEDDMEMVEVPTYVAAVLRT